MPETDHASGACSGQPVLAPPWRRLAASATDALILLLLNLCVVGVWLLLRPPGPQEEPDWGIGALILGWAYTWIGWGVFGKTLGKHLWRIRIVPASGGRMTLARGALRCIGYLVACLPARLGLAAILWDANRQGWHDRIAGTVVIRDTGPGLTSPLRRSVAPPLPAPDLLGPLRRGALPALLYIALALLMTFPVVLHLNTRRAGNVADSNVFVWDLWLFDHALRSGRPLTSTDLGYYPETVSLAYHTMNWVACAVAVPLLRVLSLTATYNVILVLTLAAGAFAMYWLAAAVTRCHWSSVVAGFAFGFSSYMMAHALGHLNLISAQFLPVTCLLFCSALITGRPTQALAGGVALGLCGLCDWYYVVFGMIAMVCLAVVALVQSRLSPAALLRTGALGLLSGGTAALVLLPLLVPAQRERGRASYMNVNLGLTTTFSADVLDLVRPSRLHSLRRPLPEQIPMEKYVTPGLAVMALAVVGLRRQRRLLAPWAAVALCGWVLACGPSLQVGGTPGPSALTGILLGGPPGTGLDLPLSGAFASHYCVGVIAHPQRALTQPGPSVVMPFYWLTQALPVLGPFKAPARLAVLAIMGLGLCASVGLSSLHDRWVADRGRKAAWAAPAALCAVILFESLAVPYPTTTTKVHWFYHWLARSPGDFAIVEAPMGPGFSAYQAYQTVHHKRLFEVHLARTPPEAFAFIEGNGLLRCLRVGSDASGDQQNGLQGSWEHPGPLLTPEARGAAEQGLRQLRRVDARFIVVHKSVAPLESARFCLTLLADRLHLPIVVDDDELTVFALK